MPARVSRRSRSRSGASRRTGTGRAPGTRARRNAGSSRPGRRPGATRWRARASRVRAATPSECGRRTLRATSSTPATTTFVYDNTNPSSTVTFPVATASYTTTTWNAGCPAPGMCGTASDAVAGVQKVEISIRRGSGNYWNGTSFSSASEVFFPATGTTAWSFSFPASQLPGQCELHDQACARPTTPGTSSRRAREKSASHHSQRRRSSRVVGAAKCTQSRSSSGRRSNTFERRCSIVTAFPALTGNAHAIGRCESRRIKGRQAGLLPFAAERVRSDPSDDLRPLPCRRSRFESIIRSHERLAVAGLFSSWDCLASRTLRLLPVGGDNAIVVGVPR